MAIGVIGVMVNIDVDRADAIAGKPAPTMTELTEEMRSTLNV
jgi:hypothetical protein